MRSLERRAEADLKSGNRPISNHAQPMPEHITSLQNDRIKAIARLEKRSERTARRLTVVEGVREVSHALATGVVPVEVYVCPELVGPESRAVVARLEALTQRSAPAFSR